MRIIGGEARGRKLIAPAGLTTRPILDQLKQRVFDVLGPVFDEVVVWDVFAGAGSLGLEAISRGAGHVVFVDQSRAAIAAITKNVETLGFGDRCRILCDDAFAVARRVRPDEAEPDVIFADPPFPLVESEPERIGAFLDDLFFTHLGPDGHLVFRTPSTHRFDALPSSLASADIRTQGANTLYFVHKHQD